MSELTNPRQTVLISCRGESSSPFGHKKKDNIITIDWHMPTSFNPTLYAISIGKNRFSLDLIQNSSVFVVNFMSIDHREEVLYCGRNSGAKVDKFLETKLTSIECEKIDCPRIKESIAYLECEVVGKHESGDHIIFIGKVVKADLHSHEARIFHTTGDSFIGL